MDLSLRKPNIAYRVRTSIAVVLKLAPPLLRYLVLIFLFSVAWSVLRATFDLSFIEALSTLGVPFVFLMWIAVE